MDGDDIQEEVSFPTAQDTATEIFGGFDGLLGHLEKTIDGMYIWVLLEPTELIDDTDNGSRASTRTVVGLR